MNAIVSAPAARLVHVPLGGRAYDILIGSGLIARAGDEIALRLKGRKAAIVTDENVAPLYLDALVASLEAAGIKSASVVLPAGEKTQSFEHLMTVCDRVLEALGVRYTQVISPCVR